MSKITFDDKENIREVDLPNKNYIGASDINEIKSSVNALYDNVVLKSYEVELRKSDLNNINSTGSVTVALSNLGCDTGETINILPQLCTAEIDPDGTVFSAADNLLIGLNNSTAVSALLSTSFLNSIEPNKVSGLQQIDESLIIESDLEFSSDSDITGGGSGSFVKVNIVYQIITA